MYGIESGWVTTIVAPSLAVHLYHSAAVWWFLSHWWSCNGDAFAHSQVDLPSWFWIYVSCSVEFVREKKKTKRP